MPPTELPPDAEAHSQRRHALPVALSIVWVLNAALLVGVFGWIAQDGDFMRSVRVLKTPSGPTPLYPPAGVSTVLPMSQGRLYALAAIGVAAVVTLAVMFAGLFFGAPRHRRIRSWLTFTTLVALWLVLITAWPQVAWAGLRWRVGRAVDAFEPIAAKLRDDWPTTDGSDPLVGVYSAYPTDKPSVLLLLGPKPARDSGMRFTSIERSPAGALRFELVGNEQDAWLEWHPDGSKPESFAGGLMLNGKYELERTVPLGDGWYVSRYSERSGVPPTF